jgi:hypothetical protein
MNTTTNKRLMIQYCLKQAMCNASEFMIGFESYRDLITDENLRSGLADPKSGVSQWFKHKPSHIETLTATEHEELLLNILDDTLEKHLIELAKDKTPKLPWYKNSAVIVWISIASIICCYFMRH